MTNYRKLMDLVDSIENTLERSYENPDIKLLRRHMANWIDTIHDIAGYKSELNSGDFKKAKDTANEIVCYLSKNYPDMSLIKLMVKCQKADIPEFEKILIPSEKNYINASDEVLTRIVNLYNEKAIVKDGHIA